MAEQILHGSNVVTAAEQGRRERVAEGVRCGGLRDACLFYGTFEGALKGLVIHVMATHDTAPWIGRMRVLRKTSGHKPVRFVSCNASSVCAHATGPEP